MAIYHLQTKPIKRSAGRSATASSAYRSATKVADERTGTVHDYSKKTGVVTSFCFAIERGEIEPLNRETLWNEAEEVEKRKDARTAREIIINLPHELDDNARQELTQELSVHLAKEYGCAIDYAIHRPDKHGDNRNHHAHIMMSTRRYEHDQLTEKTHLELSNSKLAKLGLPKSQEQIKTLRATWADMANRKLKQHNIAERIDHRSHADRGLQELPTIKLGWQASKLERKGIQTTLGNHNREVKAHNSTIIELAELRIEQETAQRVQNDDDLINRLRAEQEQEQPQQVTTRIAEQLRERQEETPYTQIEINRDKQLADELEQAKTTAEKKAIVTKQIGTLETRINGYEKILLKYKELEKILAERLRKTDLKPLYDRLRPLVDKINDHKKNEPLVIGKAKWKEWLDNAMQRYTPMRKEFEELKTKTIQEYIEDNQMRVNRAMSHEHPSEYKDAKNALKCYREDTTKKERKTQQLQGLQQTEQLEKLRNKREQEREQEHSKPSMGR